MNIWKSVHYLCFILFFLGFEQVQEILDLQFHKDWLTHKLFVAPLAIFMTLDGIANAKFTWFPWQRKDADKKVVNDERDGY